MTDFRDAHVLITGAAGGIGRLLALGAAARGARTTLLDLDEAGLFAVRAEIAQAGGEAEVFAVDLCDRAGFQVTAARVLATRGPVDILINNAGIVTGKTLLRCSDAAIERTFQVNTLALFWSVRALLPAMIARGRGHVVTIASAAGLGGTSRLTDYCASKFAVVGFSEALRQELRPRGIAVSVLCPPDTDTPGLAHEDLTKPAETKAVSGGAKLMQPDAVAVEMLQGIGRGTFMIVPGGDGKLAYFMKRHAPGVVDAIMRRGIRKARV